MLPANSVSAKQTAKCEPVRCEMKIRSLGMELKRKDRQTKSEKTATKITHRFAFANHPDATNDKQQTDEEQHSGLR